MFDLTSSPDLPFIQQRLQQQVLPTGWTRRTIQTLRQKALRLVGKVTKSARRLTLKVRASLDQIDKLRTVRRLIYQLA